MVDALSLAGVSAENAPSIEIPGVVASLFDMRNRGFLPMCRVHCSVKLLVGWGYCWLSWLRSPVGVGVL